MAETRAQAYAQQLDALTLKSAQLSAEAERRIQELLAELHREVMSDLAQAPNEYNAARIRMLKAEIDRAVAEFGSQAASAASALEEKTYREIALTVDAAVSAGTGGVLVQPVIDRAALQVVQGYTSDLITGLSHDAAARINAAIQRGYLGASRDKTVEIVGRALEGGQFSGIFSEVGKRATSIVTNEVGRINSLASVSRIKALSEHQSGIDKAWLHLPVARVPRPGHLLADGQVRKPDEAFLVQGEELMYPRDPSGSPDNTIGCHCLVRPHISDEQLKPTDGERQLLKSYGISIQTHAA